MSEYEQSVNVATLEALPEAKYADATSASARAGHTQPPASQRRHDALAAFESEVGFVEVKRWTFKDKSDGCAGCVNVKSIKSEVVVFESGLFIHEHRRAVKLSCCKPLYNNNNHHWHFYPKHLLKRAYIKQTEGTCCCCWSGDTSVVVLDFHTVPGEDDVIAHRNVVASCFSCCGLCVKKMKNVGVSSTLGSDHLELVTDAHDIEVAKEMCLFLQRYIYKLPNNVKKISEITNIAKLLTNGDLQTMGDWNELPETS